MQKTKAIMSTIAVIFLASGCSSQGKAPTYTGEEANTGVDKAYSSMISDVTSDNIDYNYLADEVFSDVTSVATNNEDIMQKIKEMPEEDAKRIANEADKNLNFMKYIDSDRMTENSKAALLYVVSVDSARMKERDLKDDYSKIKVSGIDDNRVNANLDNIDNRILLDSDVEYVHKPDQKWLIDPNSLLLDNEEDS